MYTVSSRAGGCWQPSRWEQMDAQERMSVCMLACAHMPEACRRLQDGVLAAIALCAADAEELEALGVAELCKGAEAAQQSADGGCTSPAAAEGMGCSDRLCH